MKRLEKLRHKAKSLPTDSGCYLMLNMAGEVLYVGKAKNLKSRVSSYFQNSQKGPKTEILVGHIHDFDFILTGTDAEAFVLENTLIKKHSPRYNIRLKDDKSYPYVVVDFSEPFPRPQYERRPKRSEETKVYGPFVTGSRIGQVLRVIRKSFQLRDCSVREFRSRKRPCLLYQMNQCTAPCVGHIDEKNYQRDLQAALSLFEGEGEKALDILKDRMKLASESEKFEHAGFLRDQIFLLEEFVQASHQQNMDLDHQEIPERDIDVISYHEGDIEVDLSLYMVRNGLVLGHKNFHFLGTDTIHDLEEEVMTFFIQYYTGTHEKLPQKIVMNLKEDNRNNFEKALELAIPGGGIEVSNPQGAYLSLYQITKSNATETQRVRISGFESVFVALNKLKDLLSLKERPRVLECFDVAIWQGKDPTASQVVFHDGKPDKKKYRYFHLKERPEGNNDFAMMEEMMKRRIEKGELPDIFVVDGGSAQVNTIVKILKENEIELPVVGIAKARSKGDESTDERLIIPGRSNPYILKKNPPLFRLLVQMRDEAHRFSRKLHHKAQKKNLIKSWVDQVEGVGPVLKLKLIKKMDRPINDLKEMSETELKDHFQVRSSIAQSMKKVLEEL